MRTSRWVLGSLGIVLALLLAANLAAAADTTLTSNTPFTLSLTADDSDSISLTWSANATVRCWVTDPGGNTIYDETGSSFIWPEFIDCDSAGTYTLHWQRQVSTDVSLTYDATVVPFGNVSDAFDAAFWGLVVVALVIVAIIVIVVVVVIMGDRKKKAAAQAPMAPYAAPAAAPAAVAPGTCPYCGSAVDPQYVFCQKCGGKVR